MRFRLITSERNKSEAGSLFFTVQKREMYR